jgi:hypothetical protein
MILCRQQRNVSLVLHTSGDHDPLKVQAVPAVTNGFASSRHAADRSCLISLSMMRVAKFSTCFLKGVNLVKYWKENSFSNAERIAQRL